MTTNPFRIPGFEHLSFGSIFCVGRNYAKHAAEMNSDIPEEPIIFLKPRSSLIIEDDTIRIPNISSNVHHEVELAIVIGEKADRISEAEASSVIAAYGVALDITARDIQSDAKNKGLPWSLAKGFRTFSPVGNLIPFTDSTDLPNLEIRVSVNDEVRQNGNTSDMLFSVERIISYISEYFTLWPGDLILTGTPEGVSQILPGDRIRASIGDELSLLDLHVSK
ncbi:MAG: fumarylacetoacetate hydrolase family protein [Balneolaceae bacterium]|nr:fumarylacetoacetate hydrolase family protein [Balneolaceae bacterium]MCH8549046.1 fumarylacetoacetate hydrolase family protein [Balneolaceae bacterium]